MEKFKLDIYSKEKGKSFFEIESLNTKEKTIVLNSLCKLMELISGSGLFVELERKLLSKDFDEDYTYNLATMLTDFNLKVDKHLFIVWNEEDIDKISTKNLVETWDYVWYGDSDEAVILYDNESGKILLITHYGRIYYN